MRVFVLGIWMLVALSVAAQKVDHKVHDFGSVSDWNSPKAEFVVTNTGKEDLVFLPTFPNSNLLVELPEKRIPPKGSASIFIAYYTANKGAFSEKVELYTGNSGTPIVLTVKGNIESFAPGALTACPTLKPKTDEDKAFQQQFLVIDKTTKDPILAAKIEVGQNGKRKFNGATDDRGLMKIETLIGSYDIGVWKDGYETVMMNTHLATYRGTIIIEMTPIIVEEPVLATTKPVVVEEEDEEFIDWGEEETDLVVTDEPVIEDARVEPPVTEEKPVKQPEKPVYLEDEPVVETTPDKGETKPVYLEDEPVVIEEPVKQPENPVYLEDEQPVEVIDVAQNKPVIVPDDKPVLPPKETGLATSLYVPNNVLFLIDISKSMDKPDKLPRLKQSMKELVNVLRDVDKITVITYNMEPSVLIPTTSVSHKAEILAKIDSLYGYGYTHGMKGIESAYDIIQQNYIAGGNNQIIVSTDGVFNSPRFDENELVDIIRQGNRDGIKLSVVGFGDDRDGVRLMRKLANNGGGNFIRFGTTSATEALIEEIKQQSLIE